MADFIRLQASRILAGPALDPIPNAAVLVEGKAIVAVGESSTVPTPDGCRTVDLGGATVMPGMIDAHMHTFGVDSTRLHMLATERESYRAARALSELREMLHAGFTAARCLGSTIGPDLRRAIDEGFAEAPMLRAAGAFISSTSGTWDSRDVPLASARVGGELADGADGVRRAVRERARVGVDFIKLGLSKGGVNDRYHAWGDDPLSEVTTFSLEEVQAAVDEAHRNRLTVSAHAIGDDAVRLALDGGVDIIEHGYGITPETRARIVVEKKIVVTTLSQVQFHRAAYDRFHYPDWERQVYERHWTFMIRDFKLGLDAGVRFALGTDLVGAPTHPLKEAASEFVLAVEHGMSAGDALRAGTILAAEVLGVDALTGSIEKGKFADLVAFPDDPLAEIAVVKRPLYVMKQGVTIRSDV